MKAILIACVLVAVSRGTAHAGNQFYSLGAELEFFPSGVSADGSVVVTTRHVWTATAGFTASFPTNELWTRDISNNGVVAGLFCGGTGTCYEAFRWTSTGGIQGLGTLPESPAASDTSDAYAISADGTVLVGYASSGTGPQAFRWTASTGIVGLGHLGDGDHFLDAAWAVSADGSVVAGGSQGGSGMEAFRWTQPTGMIGLGDLTGGDFHSEARAISSDGAVVVGMSTSTLGSEAFRWTAAGGMQGIGDFSGGRFSSIAYATTADGGIVGGAGESSAGLEAFLWTQATGMRSLQDVLVSDYGLGASLAGWRLTEAVDISDDGRVIVGYGYNPDGQLAGFVVSIPEPSTIVLVASMLLAGFVATIRRGGSRGI